MRADAIDRVLRDTPALLREAHVPGLSIAIVQDGAVTWTAGFGLACSRPSRVVTTSTLFQAASLSKPLFASAVLGLVERGRLDLDAPLSDYLPAPYVRDDPLLPAITARRVLCHTTGWPNWRPEGSPLIRERPPGAAFGYSGEGYNYLQAIVEYLVGRPLDAYMREAVLDPLGMAYSSYRWTAAGSPAVAQGHDSKGQPCPPYVGVRPEAASSLHTTPTNYARFLCAVLSPDQGPGRLRGESRVEMIRPQVDLSPTIAWGLGWGLEHTAAGLACWHWGDNPGYKSLVFALPTQREAVVVMTNGDRGLPLCERLIHMTLGGDRPALSWLATTIYGVPGLGAL